MIFDQIVSPERVLFDAAIVASVFAVSVILALTIQVARGERESRRMELELLSFIKMAQIFENLYARRRAVAVVDAHETTDFASK